MKTQSKFDKPSLSDPILPPPKEKFTWNNPTDKMIYQLLKEQGPLTRSHLTKQTGFPRTTIFDALTRLTIRGLVVRFSEPRQSRGRPRIFYEVVT